MRTFQLSGFPEVSPSVELPNIAELLHMPWFQYASAEDVYQYGGEVYRELLDAAPIRNDKKHVLVTSKVQYLDPQGMSIKYLNRWHTDGSGYPFKSTDRMHLLISECTARTEFNTHPVSLEVDENIHQHHFNQLLQSVQDKIGLTGRSIEANRFVTFDNSHAHRAIGATVKEFRYMFRIIESDDCVPTPIAKAKTPISFIYRDQPPSYYDKRITIDRWEKTAEYPNIEQTPHGIFIHRF